MQVRMGQTARSKALGGERQVGTTATRGKGFKTRVSGERPIGTTSFRQ